MTTTFKKIEEIGLVAPHTFRVKVEFESGNIIIGTMGKEPNGDWALWTFAADGEAK